MILRRFVLAGLWGVATVWSGFAPAEASRDAAASVPLETAAQVAWEPVVGAPIWVSGGTPREVQGGAVVFALDAGEAMTFDLVGRDAVYWIPSKRSGPGKLEAWHSGDGALYVRGTAEPDTAGGETLRLPARGGRFLELRAAVERGAPVEFRLFVASPATGSAGRSVPIDLPGTSWTLQSALPPQERGNDGAGYRLLEAGSPLSIDVSGHRFVRIDTRYRFSAADVATQASYRVLLTTPSGARWFLEHTSTPVTEGGVWAESELGGARVPIGKLRSDVVELPRGTDQLEFLPTGPVLVRVSGADSERYLLPVVNGAGATQGFVPTVGPGRSLCGDETAALGSAELRLSAGAGSRLDPRARRVASCLARDNRYRGSAEQLAKAEERLAIGSDAADRAALRRFREGSSRWENLLPQVKSPFGEIRYRRLLPPRRITVDPPAAEAREPELPAVLYREALQAEAGKGGFAYFLEAPAGETDAHVYAIARSTEPVRLRILVRGVPEALLTLGTGAGVEHELRRVEQQIPRLRDSPSLVELAWALLVGEGRPTARPDEIHPLARAHRGFVELPAGTREFKIWSDRPGVEVAVQRYTDDVFRLSESEVLYWLGLLRERGWTVSELFGRLTAAERPQVEDPVEGIALRSLWNHWLPLARYVRSQHRSFARGIRPFTNPDLRCGGSTSDPTDAMAVVVSWGRLGGECVPDAGTLADFLAALRELDENELADRFLAQSILYGGEQVARHALELWDADRRRTGDTLDRVAAAAAAAHARPSAANVDDLSDALRGHGRWDWALWVALLSAEDDRSAGAEDLVALATRTRWWMTFDRWIDAVEPGPRAFWRGERSTAESRRAVSPVGTPSDALAVDIAAAAWRDAAWMVRDAAGVERVSIPHQIRPLDYFRATEERPVRLRVPAGAALRFELRAVIPPTEDRTGDPAVRVRRAGVTERFSWAGRRRSEGLALESPRLAGQTDARAVAVREHLELEFSTAQVVEVFGDGGEVLLSVDARSAATSRSPAVTAELRESTPDRAEICLVELAAGSGEKTNDALRCFDQAEITSEPDAPAAWQSDPLVSQSDPVTEPFAKLLRDSGRGDVERQQAVALGEALWQTRGRPAEARDLYERLTLGTTWRRLTSVQSSAGIRDVEGTGWQPQAPELRLKRALFGPLDDAELILSGGQELLSDVDRSEPSAVRISIEAVVVPPYEPLPIGATVVVEGSAPKRVVLDASAPRAVLEIPLSTGRRSVLVRYDEPRSQHYVKARIDERSGSGVFEPQIRTWRRSYDVASRSEPVRMRVRGPAWLRVDELRDDRTVSSTRFVETEGWQSVELAPAPGHSESLYRVFERVPAGSVPQLAPSRESVTAESIPTIGSSWAPPEPEVPPSVVMQETPTRQRGTHSVALVARSRRLVEEDIASADDSEDFAEARWTYRRGVRPDLGGRRFLEAGLLGRERDLGSATAGLFGHLRVEPAASDWVVSVDARGYAQTVESSEWAARLEAAVGRAFDWGPKTRARFRLSAFARDLSLDVLPRLDRFGAVDQDIYTDYKASHRHGVGVSLSSTHARYRDFQLFSAIIGRTNDDLSDLDRAEAQIGVRQLIGGLRYDLRYRFARFFADDDRQADSDRQRITLAGAWERWTPTTSRWELGGAVSYDVRAAEFSGRFELSRHFSRGRALEDFRPVAAGFQDLRERRAHR